MAEMLSAKQYILSAAENRYNRKFTSLRRGPWPLIPLGSAPDSLNGVTFQSAVRTWVSF